MPDFPRVQSKGVLTTQQTSLQAPSDTTGEIFGEVAKVGQTMQESALKWSNAVDTIQKTTATANFETGMADITARAQNDPNYNNSDQYLKEIEKLRKDSLRGFSSKTAETEAGIEFGYKSKVGQIQIDNLYKKKMIDVGQSSTLRLIDMESSNPNDKSFKNINDILYGIGGTPEKPNPKSPVGAGIFSHEDAYMIERKANDDLGVNRINKDLYQAKTPEEVDAVTQKITSGAYETGGVTIDPDKKKSLLDIADRAKSNTEKKIKEQETEELARNRVDIIAGIASGQLNPEEIDIKEISEYDPKLGTAITKAKEFIKNYNPKLTKEEQRVSMSGVVSANELKKVRAYAKTVNDVFMNNDNEELGEFVLRELEKQGDGNNSSVKLAAFMQLAALKVKANNPQTPEDHKALDALNVIKKGLRFIQSTNPYLAPYAISDYIVKVFSNGSSTKEQVMEDARNVLEEKIVDRYKSVAKLPSLPNKIVDGEASIEDLQDGLNDLDGDEFIGEYSDAPSE